MWASLDTSNINIILNFSAIEWHRTFREEEAIRLCLKHFRQKNYVDVFQALIQKTRVRLEDPRLTSLYESLVVNGDYEMTENLVENAIDGTY